MSSPRLLSRLALWLALFAATPALAAPKKAAFVGRVTATDALIAIHTAKAGPGQLDVAIYVCDGAPNGLTLWFRAQVPRGQPLTLRSLSDEATLTATLGKKSVTGTIRFDDATTRDFEAARAGAGAGLYYLTIFPDGHFEADLFRGDVRLRGDRSGATFTGQLVLPNGDASDFNGAVELPGDATDFRAIVALGQIKGTTYPPFFTQTQLNLTSQFVRFGIVAGPPAVSP